MLPFHHNPKLAARIARLHSLARKHQLPIDKQSLRQAAADAAQHHKITSVPPRKRATAPRID